MSFVMKKIAHCDQCSHEWIAEVEMPARCPKRSCRSTAWHLPPPFEVGYPDLVAAVKSLPEKDQKLINDVSSKLAADFAKRLNGVTVSSALPRKIRGAKLQDEAFVPFEEVE